MPHDPNAAAAPIEVDEDELSIASSGATNFQSINVGDVIVYFPPEVFGSSWDANNLQATIVVSVRQNEQTKLVLENGAVLPDHVKVKRIKELSGDDLIDLPAEVDEGKFMPISSYVLRDGGSVKLGDAEGIRGNRAASIFLPQKEALLKDARAGLDRRLKGPASGTGASSGDDDELAPGDSLPKTKCTINHCPQLHEPKLVCSNSGCKREVHNACYDRLVARKHELAAVDGSVAFCTKKCYDKYVKDNGADSAVGLGWNSDGKLGRNDPNSSEAIVVRWMMGDGHYEKYRGGTENKGKTKLALCQDVANLCNAEGVKVLRTAKMVKCKIESIERAMRSAIDFAETETGQGLQEGDEGTWKDAIVRKCKYYFELIDIVKDRAAFVPKATTDDPDWENAGGSFDLDADDGDEGAGRKKKKKGRRASKTPKTPRDTETDRLLGDLLRIKVKKMKSLEDEGDSDVAKKVKLAKQFKEMTTALDGDKVKAAQICPEFRVFLSPGQKEELGAMRLRTGTWCERSGA